MGDVMNIEELRRECFDFISEKELKDFEDITKNTEIKNSDSNFSEFEVKVSIAMMENYNMYDHKKTLFSNIENLCKKLEAYSNKEM